MFLNSFSNLVIDFYQNDLDIEFLEYIFTINKNYLMNYFNKIYIINFNYKEFQNNEIKLKEIEKLLKINKFIEVFICTNINFKKSFNNLIQWDTCPNVYGGSLDGFLFNLEELLFKIN